MVTRLYDPWNMMNQLRRDIERAFSAIDEGSPSRDVTTAAWSPAVDIKEQGDAYLLIADIPGVEPKDIEINMEEGVLTIRGERKTDAMENRDTYTRVERVSGSFYRRFTLPDTADAENISAKSGNGVLKIRIPKQERVQPHRITVQS
jgi:HSP20 family protein